MPLILLLAHSVSMKNGNSSIQYLLIVRFVCIEDSHKIMSNLILRSDGGMKSLVKNDSYLVKEVSK